MDRIVRDLHLGPRPTVSKAFIGLRRQGYIILGDAADVALYWVNGHRLTAYQLVALALLRGISMTTTRR